MAEAPLIALWQRLFMADIRSKEMMQRIQIGLTGLAGVVLLVGLANIVIEKAGVDVTATDGAPPQVVPTTSANEIEATASEPLAELGVTAPPPEEDNAGEASAPGRVVPDLEPNPALKKPMDR